jgi:cysteine synthase/rhodanese-related sulfurtransferase
MSNHKTRVYDSILGLLSGEDNPTPLVRLNRVTPFKHATVYGKLEWYNPFGSVKDRVAANLIIDAEEKGLLAKGQKLVEPTSGNTGMGLAMMANAKGYSLTTPLSTAIPQEKRTVLRFFGSEVIELEDSLCPAPGAPEGAIAKAMSLAEQPDYHMLNQYQNPANPAAHYKTTGPEIWKQTDGKITHFISGLGTCGTITGTGRFLKEKNPDVKVFGVHPAIGHDIPGVRSIKQLEQTELFSPSEYDEMIAVDNETAFSLCSQINRLESIIAGPSSAMALAGAFRLVPDEPGVVAVVIFCDNAFKYASSIVKHVPHMGTKAPTSVKEKLAGHMIENVRANDDLTINLDGAKKIITDQEPFIVDVRGYETYAKAHIPKAISMPLEELPNLTGVLPDDREAPILCVCQKGNMSLSGTLFLVSLGYKNVRSLNGGTLGWQDGGNEVESDQ